VFFTCGRVLWCECLEVYSKGVGYFCEVYAVGGERWASCSFLA
jgi:hypothetical protein